jgi:hypothetical protein
VIIHHQRCRDECFLVLAEGFRVLGSQTVIPEKSHVPVTFIGSKLAVSATAPSKKCGRKCALLAYNSPQQKLERCVNAQRYNTEWRPGIDESYKVIYCKMHVGMPINQQPNPSD